MIAFALLALLVSCDDAINIKQPGEVNNPDVVYNTVPDLEKGLQGVYAVFSTESTIDFTAIFTDELAIGINNGGQGLNDGLYNFQLNAGSDVASSIWGANYTLINFANRILDAAKKIEPTADETDPAFDLDLRRRYERVLWQLYTMRAYAHFQLLSYYSTDLKDDSALGVIILDVVPNENYDLFLPRSTNAECFAFIEADLARADALTVPGIAATTVNPDFTLALKARMAAYRGRYQDALTYADELISFYPLVNTATDYQAIWADTSSSEIIFKLARISGDGQVGSFFASASSSLNGSPFFEVGRALYDLYSDADIRSGAALIDQTSTKSEDFGFTPDTDPQYTAHDVLVVNKYPGNEAQNDPLLNDIKVFRVSEMYLIKAEAYVGLGNLTGAATTLRTLRAARTGISSQPTYANATAAWADILLERRKELALEGFRYLDIKRLGVLAGNKGIERYTRDCAKYGSCNLDPTDHRFTMPIPTTELTANPNIRSQQNPGY